MSRCFPYPPPGYTLSKEKSEALIELIKLQKEREEIRQKRREKKERRAEKKKKRKERKERSKEKKDKTSQKADKSDTANSHEIIDADTEQFEQSGLTEEHGHPDSVPVPSSSYDSTENSNKRKRHSSPVEGKAILIRLSSKGQSDFHSLAKGLQLHPISGGIDFPARHTDDSGPENFTLKDDREEICWTYGKTGNRSSLYAVVRGVELQYKHLLESWFPPQTQDTSLYPVDSDWLYPDRRNQDVRAEKRQRSGSDSMSCSRSSTPWPCAEYLGEIDAFALPYVVPF
ncbi:hypothetical protein C2S53_003459 [Perilla frutescens var. hirtella]|uniref:Uncharacterized protein n=1 Tax=Perilla frutescens var. hirtella TaxID=608512 RepID=A0AAD4NYC1_PERFH|nr:hypothetical protein C2S53_003459 [Perilla frutescens var. hirtella]